MDSKLELCPDFVYFFEQQVSRDEAITKLVSLLRAKDYVRASYEQAVLEREKIYPTGLPTEPYGIAIPHTDPEHVNLGSMAVGILSQPVTFVEMGSLDAVVSVDIISMLAIKDADGLVHVLRQLAQSFQNKEFLIALKEAADPRTVVDLFARVAPDVIAAA